MTISIIPDDDASQKLIILNPSPDSEMDVKKVERKRKQLQAITLGARQALQRGTHTYSAARYELKSRTTLYR